MAEDNLSSSQSFVEERLGTLQFGFNDGLQNTEIFRYSARRAQQGMAYVRQKGRESLFITVRASDLTGQDKGQSCRITRFDFASDGRLDTRPVEFSKVLPIGHGQGFGVVVNKGQLFFYCMSHYTKDSSVRYKAVSRVHWRGATTGPEDVEEIPLLPATGDLSRYGFLTPTVSTDGKHLVTLCKVKGGGHACLIWRMSDLRPYARPWRIFPVPNGIAMGHGWQGICADSRRIHVVHGPISSLMRHAIATFDYQGHLVREFIIQDEKAVFGGDQGIKTWSRGVPWNIELEGIVIRGSDLLVTGVCTVSPAGDVVRWNNTNYVCFKTTDGTQKPDNLANWLPTSRIATAGDFIEGLSYYSGVEKEGNKRLYLYKYKYVYRIVGAAQ